MAKTERRAVVFLADGFEDIEAVTPIDYLSRAGIEITTVSISDSLIVTSRWGGIRITADTTLNELVKQGNNIYDAVIIPGGMSGAANLAACEKAGSFIKEMAAAGKTICAICASPVIVLAPLGLITGRKFTCYPALEEKVTDAVWSDERVVTDGNIITSRSAGTAGEFAVAIIKKLTDIETAEKISESVLL